MMGFGAQPAPASEQLDGHNLDDCQCPQVRPGPTAAHPQDNRASLVEW